MEEYPRIYHSRHHYATAHRNTSHKQPIRAAVLRKPASPLKMEQLKLKARVMMKTHPPATERNWGVKKKQKFISALFSVFHRASNPSRYRLTD
jgi:hypothetical protein